MSSAKSALAQRIRQMRRKHFGARGKPEFARRLRVPLEEYDRFEAGTVPRGDVLVRMSEITGEDLQWLLTGRPSRGVLMITNARTRHRDLLARVAQLLDRDPVYARALEAFLDLLVGSLQTRSRLRPALPAPGRSGRHAIPILECSELPDSLPGPEGRWPAEIGTLARRAAPTGRELVRRVPLHDVAFADGRTVTRTARLERCGSGRRARTWLFCQELSNLHEGLFGVRLPDDRMKPRFDRGDVVLVAPGVEPELGCPALCRVRGRQRAVCGNWLGRREGRVRLARERDGKIEELNEADVCWSLMVLYYLPLAAGAVGVVATGYGGARVPPRRRTGRVAEPRFACRVPGQ